MLRYVLIALALVFIGSIADVPVMFLAVRGALPLAFVFIAGFLADVIPDFFWYWLGGKIGLERFGRLPFFRQDKRRLRRVDQAFHRYGAYILFASKFAYAFGIPSQIVAGAHRYSLRKMFLANALGSAGWLLLLYWLARAFKTVRLIEDYINDAKADFLIFVIVGVMLYFLIGLPLRKLFASREE